MTAENPFRVLLDVGVPDSVGRAFATRGHTVIYYREVLSEREPDEVVCATALANSAILIAIDGDMKRLAKRYGKEQRSVRFERLNLIKIGCNPVQAANRAEQAMSFIEHEWAFSEAKSARRLWVEIGLHHFTTHR